MSQTNVNINKFANKICDKSCKCFCCVGNTDETGQGICTLTYNWEPVKIGDKCYLARSEYKCKDCTGFGDAACLTCKGEDPVNGCSEFESLEERDIKDSLTEWAIRGMSIEDIESELLNVFQTWKRDAKETLDKIAEM